MSRYFVDPEDLQEMGRLLKQSFFLMRMFGGILSERPDLGGMHRILDIACGTGQWATEVARKHSSVEVRGMDLSLRMIEFASAKAAQDGVENVFFEVADATKLPLPYEDNSFHLVNASLIY